MPEKERKYPAENMETSRFKLIFTITFILALVLYFMIPGEAAYKPGKIPGTSVYFLPIGKIQEPKIDYLKIYYKKKFKLDIKILPSLPLDPIAYNSLRKQYSAEKMLQYGEKAYPKISKNPASYLFILTDVDIYTFNEDWRFALCVRNAKTLRSCIISFARLKTGYDRKKLNSRAVKLINKNLGILYWKLPVSNDPKSPMFTPIMGTGDLDRMSEKF